MKQFSLTTKPNPVVDAKSYLYSIQELTERNTTAEKTQPIQKHENIPSYITAIPYAPYLLAGILFVVVFGVQIANKVSSAKQIITALVIALFAASLPSALPYLHTGVRQETKAGPQTQPKQILVIRTSPTTATISWQTDIPTVGALRIWEYGTGESKERVIYSSQRIKVNTHETFVTKLEDKHIYLFEILSDTTWYANGSIPAQFIFTGK